MNIERIDNKRTIVFIDASNFHYALRKHGWEIDYKKFKDWIPAFARMTEWMDVVCHSRPDRESSVFCCRLWRPN